MANTVLQCEDTETLISQIVAAEGSIDDILVQVGAFNKELMDAGDGKVGAANQRLLDSLVNIGGAEMRKVCDSLVNYIEGNLMMAACSLHYAQTGERHQRDTLNH